MQLSLAIHPVTSIQFGARTGLVGTTLSIQQDELRRLVLEESSFAAVDFELARPGDSLRAGPIFDIVEPRAKAPGGSPDWPGILGEPHTAGSGTTHVLEGAAVAVVREDSPGESRGATGYVLEMSGAPAASSHYATLCHLIMVPHSKSDVPAHARQRAYRLAQLKIAVHLARAALNEIPARTLSLDTAIAADRVGLPRIAYVGQIFSRQRKPLQDESILYGADTDGMLPTVLHPNEWLDGALLPSYHCSLGRRGNLFLSKPSGHHDTVSAPSGGRIELCRLRGDHRVGG